MTRLCLMGNSHLAALKLGWDRLRDAHPDVAVTFFGSRGAGVCKGMRLEGGALVPSAQDLVNFRWTSGGLKEIRLEDFDCFALVALGFAPRWVWRLARRFEESAVLAALIFFEACRSPWRAWTSPALGAGSLSSSERPSIRWVMRRCRRSSRAVTVPRLHCRR